MKGIKRNRGRNAVNEYAFKTASYLIIMLAVTIAAVFVLIDPVTELVHKVEAHVSMEARDIVLDDSTYNPSADKNGEAPKYNFGEKIGVITSDSFGLNSSIYCGANRISMADGVGFHSESGIIGGDDSTVITGYMEGAFSPLEYAENGDVLNISTSYGEFSYKISSVQYLKNNDSSFNNSASDLVLCGICSDFSQHSGERLIVLADIADGEVH